MADEFYSLHMLVLRGLAEEFWRRAKLFFFTDTEQDTFLKTLANEENQ